MENAVQQFWQDGAVHLPGLIDAQTLLLLSEGIDQSAQQQTNYGERLTYGNDKGWFFNDYFQWQDIPAYKKVVFESNLGGP